MTSDLVTFLNARLDEDEQMARSTPGPSWEHRQIRGDFDESVVFENYVAVADPGRNTVALADVAEEVLPFVLRHDPARVLAEVDAKRRIIDRYEAQRTVYAAHMGGILTKYLVQELEAVLRLLALPFADHPDYRPEWTPAD